MKSFLKLEQILADHIDSFLVPCSDFSVHILNLLRLVQSQLYEETSWLWMQLYQDWTGITIFPFTLLDLPNTFWKEEYSWSQLWLWGSGPNFIASAKSFQLLLPRCAERWGRHTSNEPSTTVEQNRNTNWKKKHMLAVGVHRTHAVTRRVTALTAEVQQTCFWTPCVPTQAMKKVTRFLKTWWYYIAESNLYLLLECWLLVGTIKN